MSKGMLAQACSGFCLTACSAKFRLIVYIDWYCPEMVIHVKTFHRKCCAWTLKVHCWAPELPHCGPWMLIFGPLNCLIAGPECSFLGPWTVSLWALNAPFRAPELPHFVPWMLLFGPLNCLIAGPEGSFLGPWTASFQHTMGDQWRYWMMKW